MMVTVDDHPSQPQWYVLRDLRRGNARLTAYDELCQSGYDVFTPQRWEVVNRAGRRVRRLVPVIPDLLFVHTTREAFDPVVQRIPSLQYRYARGAQAMPMVVRNAEMAAFIYAVRSLSDVRYFNPEEVTPDMCGREIRIVGGPLDGYEGRLLKVRGTRVKRLLINLPGLIMAAVEVEPEFIQFVGP